VPFVFSFDHDHDEAPRRLAHLLGSKGADLAEMTSALGLPVPPGFTLTTEACELVRSTGSMPNVLEAEVNEHLKVLCGVAGCEMGSADQPLLVSVRSGAIVPMPGALRSVLDLGLNDVTVAGLARSTGDERFAYDTYRRLIEMYGTVVMDVPEELFEHRYESAKLLAGVADDAEVPTEVLKSVIERYLMMIETTTGTSFPQDPATQIRGALEAAFRSWDARQARDYRNRERIPHDLGLAVSVQQMVFGNSGSDSGSGVTFTRSPWSSTAGVGLFGDFTVCSQGEDVVGGLVRPLPMTEKQRQTHSAHLETSLESAYPAIYERLKERVVHVHLSNHNGQEHQLLRLFVLYVPLVFAGSALFGLQGIFGAAASANDVAGIAAYLWLRRILAGESLRWKAAAVGEVGGKAAAVGE